MRAQGDAAELLAGKLTSAIEEIDDGLDGVLGVAVLDLTSGMTIQYNADAIFPQASVIKVPVMLRVFQAAREGHFRLDDKVTISPADAVAGGELYGPLQRGPLTLSIEELMAAMIRSSDNTAANKLIRMVEMESVTKAVQGLGLRNTKLRRVMLDGGAVRRSEENVSTPMEMARLFQAIFEGKAVDTEASKQMTEILKQVDGDVRKTVPAEIAVAAKDGEYPGTRAETAIVYLPNRPFVLSVSATFLRPGANPVPEVAALVWQYFEKLAASNRYGNRVK